MISKPSGKLFLIIIVGGVFAGLLFLFLSQPTKTGGSEVFLAEKNLTPTAVRPTPQVYQSQPLIFRAIAQFFHRNEIPTDPSQITGQYPLLDDGRYFQLYQQPGVKEPDLVWWRQESEQVVDTVSQRLGINLPQKVVVLFSPAQSGDCVPRGVNYSTTPPMIVIYARPGISHEETLAILAHELGHVLSRQRYGEIKDLALNEGLATWAAGPYWWDWKGGTFDENTIGLYEQGEYLPLYINYTLDRAYDTKSETCLIDRDMLLTELAAFIDYLIQTYGEDKFIDLLQSPGVEVRDGQRTVFPPDYFGSYGLELNQLENQWLISLLPAQSTP